MISQGPSHEDIAWRVQELIKSDDVGMLQEPEPSDGLIFCLQSQILKTRSPRIPGRPLTSCHKAPAGPKKDPKRAPGGPKPAKHCVSRVFMRVQGCGCRIWISLLIFSCMFICSIFRLLMILIATCETGFVAFSQAWCPRPHMTLVKHAF